MLCSGAKSLAKVVGGDKKVPLLDDTWIRYVNFDNAASTPCFQTVAALVNQILPDYSSVHRGSGYKSRLCTMYYEQAREIIAEFVGTSLETNTVIFGKNTTEAIIKLSNSFPLQSNDVILSTLSSHHSNDLPWRRRASVIHVDATADGRLDEADFDRKLGHYGARVALVALNGASNVTGFIQPIGRLTRKAHAVGAKVLVDAAQLAPHRKIDMKPDDHPEHIDFLALSGHKMYAPFGTGALIGAKDTFLESAPCDPGGGTVDIVTLDEVHWADLPDREEAGTPNVIGAMAMAKAAQVLQEIGMDVVADHEAKLISYALERLKDVPGIILYGESDPEKTDDRVGVIPFNLSGFDHALVAAILGYEGAIGVRNGCFCAHPYVVHLLQLGDDEQALWRERHLNGDTSSKPGMVRMSFGIYNSFEEIDRIVDLLNKIASGRYLTDCYEIEAKTGDYHPHLFSQGLTADTLLSVDNMCT